MQELLSQQLQGLVDQKRQLEAMLAQLPSDQGDSMQPLLDQLVGTIQTVEAELTRLREQEAAQADADEEGGLHVGMKVIVRRFNGQLADATIESLTPEDTEDENLCLISWSHPRNRQEIVCCYWQKGSCRKGRSCPYSHGTLWKKSDFQPIDERWNEGRQQMIPYGSERTPLVGERVLALYFHDGAWYEGVIDEIIHHSDGSRPTCMVRMNKSNSTTSSSSSSGGGGAGQELTEVEAHESCLVPLSFFEAAASRLKRSLEEDDDEEEWEVHRWHGGPRALGTLAAGVGWDRHTKGVGFRLLQKMGLQAGQGLGRDKQGIVEPIEIVIYEPKVGLGGEGGEGKLAEFRDVEAEVKDDGEGKPKRAKGDPMSVFSFINNLSVEGDSIEKGADAEHDDIVDPHVKERRRAEAEGLRQKALVGKDEAELRIDALRSKGQAEEMKTRLSSLREAFKRHEKTNPTYAASIQKKIEELEGRLAALQGDGHRIKAVLSKKKEEKKRGKHLF